MDIMIPPFRTLEAYHMLYMMMVSSGCYGPLSGVPCAPGAGSQAVYVALWMTNITFCNVLGSSPAHKERM